MLSTLTTVPLCDIFHVYSRTSAVRHSVRRRGWTFVYPLEIARAVFTKLSRACKERRPPVPACMFALEMLRYLESLKIAAKTFACIERKRSALPFRVRNLQKRKTLFAKCTTGEERRMGWMNQFLVEYERFRHTGWSYHAVKNPSDMMTHFTCSNLLRFFNRN